MDEKGYIKFNCNWIKTEPVSYDLINELNLCRIKLFEKGLIGKYPNGIGFGNVSIRQNNNTFLITGTSTGGLSNLTEQHYTKVVDYDFEQNRLTCEGPIKASSESLTHAAIYESYCHANTVIHVHSKNLWEQLIDKVPTTSPKVEYGTPEMALEIKRLFDKTDLINKRILVMAGHEEGIITFGACIKEAYDTLLKFL